jgi:UDP-hydrolysing UDP-N-acetyl-D-glucosamine 2-epimerase
VTGSRAEFGLLQPIMQAIAEHPALHLQTIVTGAHLIGESQRDIPQAGFAIDAEAVMQRGHHTGRAADTDALGRGIQSIGEALQRLKPNVVLVLGDRIEALAGACAASVGGFYLAHVHGGDRAEGVADEAMRHAISKLAHLHFPATAQSRRRLLRLGESSDRVYRVGSPAIDGLHEIQAADDVPALLVMQHPVGADPADEQASMAQILAATADQSRLVMMPNHDPLKR